jgi:2-oxoglutarate ferredoxin oxidoreductase subunit beta
MFNGLPGRSLPAAVAIKMVNPELVVIAESGDG